MLTVKQLLLITSLVLLFVLRSATNLSAQVHQYRQAALHAEKEMQEARRLSFASEQYVTQIMKVTKYAPTAPDAVPGHDYTGDPRITASGEKVVPGKTAAAGPNIPFGTEIYVEGQGWYIVQDRGSGIGPNNIDLACSSREEAIEFGQQELLVVFKKPHD